MKTYSAIAVDAMGGDFGPRVTIPATLLALKKHPDITAFLVGDTGKISPFLNRLSSDLKSRISVHHCDDVITSEDKPSFALRRGQQSSMYQALQLVAEEKAQACISAGNTGALMVLGRHILRTLPGIDRPAITTAIPTLKGHSYMLDLGANVDCSAKHLLQFAIMGSVMTSAVEHIEQPRVGLLNIGQEEIKGNEQVKLASRLIEEHGEINYIGYIEGNDLYTGKADVIVCDGFVGNIALKSSEGLARLINRKMKVSFRQSIYRRFMALLAKPALLDLQKQIDPSRRNGASLLGLQGIVVKSHGGANKQCFGYAFDQAVAEIDMAVPMQIGRKIERYTS